MCKKMCTYRYTQEDKSLGQPFACSTPTSRTSETNIGIQPQISRLSIREAVLRIQVLKLTKVRSHWAYRVRSLIRTSLPKNSLERPHNENKWGTRVSVDVNRQHTHYDNFLINYMLITYFWLDNIPIMSSFKVMFSIIRLHWNGRLIVNLNNIRTIEFWRFDPKSYMYIFPLYFAPNKRLFPYRYNNMDTIRVDSSTEKPHPSTRALFFPVYVFLLIKVSLMCFNIFNKKIVQQESITLEHLRKRHWGYLTRFFSSFL